MKIGAHKIKPCGKYFNQSIYVHKYFASFVKQIDIGLVHHAAKYLPKDFKYDIIRFDRNTNNISFIQLIGFDTADVPLVGDSYLVRSDLYAANRKDGKKVKHTRMKDDPQIKLHKWLYVPQDYKGFDWNESVKFSEKLADGGSLPTFQKLSDYIAYAKSKGIDTKGAEIYITKKETKPKKERILKQKDMAKKSIKEYGTDLKKEYDEIQKKAKTLTNKIRKRAKLLLKLRPDHPYLEGINEEVINTMSADMVLFIILRVERDYVEQTRQIELFETKTKENE